ncbi:hypothetical protein [Sulfurirhabdus autotrophica]|uniref:Tellurite resistance protein TehA-like permease n=1 Tax=Sulfurirhabdus autotrophica TaxID=1706046 RepID=A0A4R3XS06_9PROT|nr:hypothetical protein [Sulfurirhabdus autotrophica]TCV79971.1 tellurite resistance protein TehA-like permease [Sulfurirhabdus autotrophica]
MESVNSTNNQEKVASPPDWLTRVPVPIFGAPLGLLGLSLVSAMNEYLAKIPMLKTISLILGAVILITGILTHMTRWAIRRDAFMRDLRNVAIAPFFGQIGIAFLLLAEGTRELNGQVAQTAFLAGSAVSSLLTFYWLFIGSRQKFALSGVTPGWLVPPIGLLYVGLLAPVFNMDMISSTALIAGSISAIGSIGLLCTRLIMGPSLPSPAKPALAIAVAIPALMLLAILESNALRASIFANTLFFTTAFSYIVSIGVFAKIMNGKFALSWWAFGMPLIAAAIAFTAFSHIHTSLFISVLANASAFLGLVIVTGLSISSLDAVRQHFAYKAK